MSGSEKHKTGPTTQHTPSSAARLLAEMEMHHPRGRIGYIAQGDSLSALRRAFPDYSDAVLSSLLTRARRKLGIQNTNREGRRPRTH